MFASKLVPRLRLLQRATCVLEANGEISGVQPFRPAFCSQLKQKQRNYSTEANHRSPPRWVQLEPELEDTLIPRKLSVSPLESWLSLRYSLPPLLESPLPQEEVELLEEKVLPPLSIPVMEDGNDSATPLSCKNILKIRRRMMNRHKYRKLQQRRKFVIKRIKDGREKKKQAQFEKDLKRIWKRAGLKAAPGGLSIPQVYIRRFRNK